MFSSYVLDIITFADSPVEIITITLSRKNTTVTMVKTTIARFGGVVECCNFFVMTKAGILTNAPNHMPKKDTQRYF